ncbi:ABC transporter ATP-binding protein [Streptomyces sp. NPDC003247]|uniref:ABC transporter ATP-binding protein n=1 Tax=Streptomyces sp. NPDC003247 TaxID=3364677 RepID=UPI0036A724B4
MTDTPRTASGTATPAPAPGTAADMLPLLEVTGLRITATGAAASATVVDGVGLRVAPGECVGVVGESGSGKSLLVRAVAGLLPEGVAVTGGSVRLAGREALGLADGERHALRGRRLTLLLQDPFTMLHPQLTCGRQIADGLRDDHPALTAARGRRARQATRRAEVVRRLAEVGLEPAVADRYPHELSGGMRQRVAAAAALAGDPDLLVADEPTTALDAANQRALLDLLRGLQRRRGMGLLLITHDLSVAFSTCDRVYVLYAGSVLEQGAAADLRRAPRHPYTAALLAAEPSVHTRHERLPALPGSVPPPGSRGAGCPFADRCPHAAPECRTEPLRLRVPPRARPDREAEGEQRLSACVRLAALGEHLLPAATGTPGRARAEAAAAATAADQPDALRTEPHDTPPAPPTASPEAPPALRMTGVHRTFQGSGEPHPAVRDVTLTVPDGRITALVGESGSGKTTLARIAVGLESFDAGQVDVGDVSLSAGRLPAGARRTRLASRAQIVFQDPFSSLDPLRTVGATLAEALTAAGRLPDGRRRERRLRLRARVEELLTQVGLPTAHARRRPAGLSGGERQRVAIARALAVRPRLLVCDEAVAALDVSVQAQLLNLLTELQRAEGFAVLFITHDLGVVRQIADEVAVMYRGELVEQGSVSRVLDRPGHAWTRRMLDSLPDPTRAAATPVADGPVLPITPDTPAPTT